jgi:hypothetical protein
MNPIVKTICLKCGQAQRINFGPLGFADALAAMDKFDVPGECPGGYHVELSGWPMLWQFGSALVLVYGAEAERSTTVQQMLASEAAYREQTKATHLAKPELEVGTEEKAVA